MLLNPIWHERLFYGLYDIIQSMLSDNNCRIQISNNPSLEVAEQILAARSNTDSIPSTKSDNHSLNLHSEYLMIIQNEDKTLTHFKRMSAIYIW